MPIRYIDPTGLEAQFNDMSEGGGFDRLLNNIESEWSPGGGEKAFGGIRSNIDTSDRVQAYTIQEIVKGITGGDQSSANAIISNFITTQGSPFNVRGHFFNMLESWEVAPPLNSMWLVFFTVPDIVRDELMGAWGEHIVMLQTRKKLVPNADPNIVNGEEELDGGVNLARRRLLGTDKFTKVLGCAFAQTVTVPQEQLQTDHVGIPNSRGFLYTPVVSHRQRFSSLNIEFLETNISFVDFLLRPWTVLGSHFGSVARPESLVTDVMLVNFARAGVDPEFVDGGSVHSSSYNDMQMQNKRGFIPRKIWIFSGAQPVTIDSQRHSYTDTGIERRTIEWMFRRYQTYLPTQFEDLFQTVDDIEEGKGRSSPGQGPNKVETAEKLHTAGQLMYYTSNDERASRIIASDTLYWAGKDGDSNEFDRPGIPKSMGDKGARKLSDFSGKNMAMIKSVAETEANYYWEHGKDKQFSGNSKLGGALWLIDGRGVDTAPGYVPIDHKGAKHEGWDKEPDGESRLYKTERPHGYKGKSSHDALLEAKKESGRYGDGQIQFNKNLNTDEDPDNNITPVDPQKYRMGGSWGPDGGRRYRIPYERPYGLHFIGPKNGDQFLNLDPGEAMASNAVKATGDVESSPGDYMEAETQQYGLPSSAVQSDTFTVASGPVDAPVDAALYGPSSPGPRPSYRRGTNYMFKLTHEPGASRQIAV